MNEFENTKKSKHSVNNILFWSVGILLIVTMLSSWFVSGLFAKYIVTETYADAAIVAGASGQLKLLEHEASLENGEYKLNQAKEVTGNTYEKVIPGVDIAKDPFIKLDIDSKFTYELYVKVIKSNPFPDTVTYELTEDWELVDEVNGIYKYKKAINAQPSDTIKILKNDKLYVSEHYVGKDKDGKNLEFSLTFEAWLVQTGMN